MRNKLAWVAILAAATACLSGCSYLRPTGPCFGTGCPARTVGHNGQYKLGEGPKKATALATPASKVPSPSTQKALGN